MKKKVLSLAILFSIGMFSCSSETETKTEEVVEKTAPEEEIIEETKTEEEVVEDSTSEISEEEVVEETDVNSLAEFIIGNWSQTGKDCDKKGENCKNLKEPKSWVFTSNTVTKNDEKKDFTLDGKSIIIGKNKWNIIKQTGKTIILHAVKSDRYLKLEKK